MGPENPGIEILWIVRKQRCDWGPRKKTEPMGRSNKLKDVWSNTALIKAKINIPTVNLGVSLSFT